MVTHDNLDTAIRFILAVSLFGFVASSVFFWFKIESLAKEARKYGVATNSFSPARKYIDVKDARCPSWIREKYRSYKFQTWLWIAVFVFPLIVYKIFLMKYFF
jgi:hypothetical protein